MKQAIKIVACIGIAVVAIFTVISTKDSFSLLVASIAMYCIVKSAN